MGIDLKKRLWLPQQMMFEDYSVNW